MEKFATPLHFFKKKNKNLPSLFAILISRYLKKHIKRQIEL